MASLEMWSPKEKEKGNNLLSNIMSKFKGFKISAKARKRLGIIIGVLLLFAALFYVLIGRHAVRAYSISKDLRDNVSMVRAGFTNRDLIEINHGIDGIEANIQDTRELHSSGLRIFGGIWFIRPYYEDFSHFLDAGDHLIFSARELMVLVEPFADAMGLRVSEDQEVVEASFMQAFSHWVSIMPEIADDTDELIQGLALAGEALSQVDPERYPESIRNHEIRSNLIRAQTSLVSLGEAAPDIKRALHVIPGLVGADGNEKRYMILMQNDKEIRPTGGFWTNFATFRMLDAALSSNFSSYDMYSIDFALEVIDSFHTFPRAPVPYQTYLEVQRLYARDANTSPDFPTSLENFMEFYELGMNVAPDFLKPVDGFIAIDTFVLEELLDVTGPVEVNGMVYDSENVVLEIEKLASLTLREQAGRKDVLGHLMEAMLVKILESESNLWPEFIEKGVDLSIRKHILFNMFDQEAQELLEEYRLAGRILDPVEGDYAYVVSTNLGGDKTNWFVEKEVYHELEEVDDRWKRTVTVVYDYPRPPAEYNPFIKAYQDWLRLYVPLGSELINITGVQAGFGGGEERNKEYFDGFIRLNPDEQHEVIFEYYLPDEIIGSDGDYKITIQKQPGIYEEVHYVLGESHILKNDIDLSFSL